MRRFRFTLLLLILSSTMSPHLRAQSMVITTVDELYDAVNDPGNAGVTLMLAPGIYALTTHDGNGQPRPRGGRLEFQYDMSIVGVAGDRNAVVIDAWNLPASSFPQTVDGVATGPNAPVRLGLGVNRLAWLTVRDARFAQANIDSGLQPLDPEPAVVRIAHIASSGSTRGLNVLNFGPATSGQVLDAEIEDSHFHDNALNLSEGVRAGNFQGAVDSTVLLRMSGNASWGQKQGRLIVNNRAMNSRVTVFSSGNRFYDNGGGTIIVGGLSSNNTRADGNVIDFEAHGDHFTGNTGATEFDRGGLIVIGTENISPVSGGGSGNTVSVRLWGTRMGGNGLADLLAIGARSAPETTASLSQDNRVTIEIGGEGGGGGPWQPVELVADSVPDSPTYGNSATVIR